MKLLKSFLRIFDLRYIPFVGFVFAGGLVALAMFTMPVVMGLSLPLSAMIGIIAIAGIVGAIAEGLARLIAYWDPIARFLQHVSAVSFTLRTALLTIVLGALAIGLLLAANAPWVASFVAIVGLPLAVISVLAVTFITSFIVNVIDLIGLKINNQSKWYSKLRKIAERTLLYSFLIAGIVATVLFSATSLGPALVSLIGTSIATLVGISPMAGVVLGAIAMGIGIIAGAVVISTLLALIFAFVDTLLSPNQKVERMVLAEQEDSSYSISSIVKFCTSSTKIDENDDVGYEEILKQREQSNLGCSSVVNCFSTLFGKVSSICGNGSDDSVIEEKLNYLRNNRKTAENFKCE